MTLSKLLSIIIKESPDFLVANREEPLDDEQRMQSLYDDDAYDKRLSFKSDDARTFIIYQNYIKMSLDRTNYHSVLFKHILLNDEESSWGFYSDIKTKGELPEPVFNKIKNLQKSKSTELDRDNVLKEIPNLIQGRLWNDHDIISFWNRPDNIKSQYSYIIKFITDFLHKNPIDFLFEIEDDIYTLNEMEKLFQKPLTDETNTDFEQKTQMSHLLSPEIKGQVLKAQGAVPRKPLGAQQRFAMGE